MKEQVLAPDITRSISINATMVNIYCHTLSLDALENENMAVGSFIQGIMDRWNYTKENSIYIAGKYIKVYEEGSLGFSFN